MEERFGSVATGVILGVSYASGWLMVVIAAIYSMNTLIARYALAASPARRRYP